MLHTHMMCREARGPHRHVDCVHSSVVGLAGISLGPLGSPGNREGKASILCRGFSRMVPTPVMMWASSVTSFVSSGLPPNPTEWSHLCPCISQWVQPYRAGRSLR